MANRFDSFDKEELAIIGTGLAIAAMSLSQAGIDNATTGEDGDERGMIAAVALDCARLMNEIAAADQWGDDPPPRVGDDVLQGLIEVRDRNRPA